MELAVLRLVVAVAFAASWYDPVACIWNIGELFMKFYFEGYGDNLHLINNVNGLI